MSPLPPVLNPTSSSNGSVSFFWSMVIMILVVGASLWLLSDILFPFLMAFIIAYLLNPIVDSLSRITKGMMTRGRSSLLILIIFFTSVLFIAGITSPFFVREMLYLANILPDSIDQVFDRTTALLAYFNINLESIGSHDGIAQIFKSAITPGLRSGADMLSNIISGGGAAISTLITFFLTPLLTYFIMAEWPRMCDIIHQLIPHRLRQTTSTLIKKIDHRLSGFIRGQLIVCAIMAVFYTSGLVIIGVPYALFIGVISGVLLIIPFFGIAVGLILSLMIAAFQIPDLISYSIFGSIIGLYVLGTLIEGNVITPKIIGNRVGLHPIAIIFALMVGGYTSGIFGMMIAIPTAAVISVFIEYALTQYKSSRLYTGT